MSRQRRVRHREDRPRTERECARRSASRAGPAAAVEWDPALVEEAVLRAVRARCEMEAALRGARDRLYELPDAEERERAFRRLHAEWFVRLGLDAPVRQAVAGVRAHVPIGRMLVIRARTGREEGAEFVATNPAAHPEEPAAVLRVRPERLAAPEALASDLGRALLRAWDRYREPRSPRRPGPPGGPGPMG